MRDPTLVGDRNKTFFIRALKSLRNGHVLKFLRGSSKRTIFASGELELLQSKSSGVKSEFRIVNMNHYKDSI